jgi:hypothetical protein
MRYSIVFILVVLMSSFSIENDSKFVGDFSNTVENSVLYIRANGNFYFIYRYEMSTSWTNGTWKSKADTIFFEMVPVYDTVELSSPTRDSLILSVDSIPSRKSVKHMDGYFGVKQNMRKAPDKLMYLNGDLYQILINGQPDDKPKKGNPVKYFKRSTSAPK